MKFVPNSVTTLSADLSVIDIACTMEFVHGKKFINTKLSFFSSFQNPKKLKSPFINSLLSSFYLRHSVKSRKEKKEKMKKNKDR